MMPKAKFDFINVMLKLFDFPSYPNHVEGMIALEDKYDLHHYRMITILR